MNGKNLKSKILLRQLYMMLSYLLVFCLVFSSVTVYGSEYEEETTTAVGFDDFLFSWDWDVLCTYLITSCGYIGDTAGAVWHDLTIGVESILTGVDGFEDNGDGTVTVTVETIPADVLEEIRDLLKEYIEQEEPYEIYYPQDSDMGYPFTHFVKGISPSSQTALRKLFLEYGGFKMYGNYGSNWIEFAVVDSSEYKYAYWDSSAGSVRFVDMDLMPSYCVYGYRGEGLLDESGSKVSPKGEFTYDDVVYALNNSGYQYDGYYKTDGNKVNSTTTMRFGRVRNSANEDFRISYYFGKPIAVFDSADALSEWVLSAPIAYTTTNFNLPQNDLKIDPNTINKYDDELMTKIYNQLVANGKNAISAEELQNIIDNTVSNFLESINGNIQDVENIGKDTNAKIDYTNSILNTILHEDRVFFEQIGINNQKLIGFIEDIKKSVESIKKNSEKMLDKLDRLIDVSTLDLLNDLFGDEDPTSGINGLSNAFTFTELFKSKFPFSMPWDLYAMFALFAAEPVCPDFTIPLTFTIWDWSETFEIPINGSDWEYISYLSRSLHTVLFCSYLYKFTLKFIVKR